MKTPDPHLFKSGRDFAAWLGRTFDRRQGAATVIWQTRRGAANNPSGWLMALLERKAPKLAAVALANKMARIAGKLMASGERYAGASRAIAAA